MSMLISQNIKHLHDLFLHVCLSSPVDMKFENQATGYIGGVCPEGYYCPEETGNPINCPETYYCPKTTSMYTLHCDPGIIHIQYTVHYTLYTIHYTI